ncbi:MAG TPA: protein kinase, partial [Terriglobales bacterium]|nr:protein kinase [Terriglobales bacterium]
MSPFVLEEVAKAYWHGEGKSVVGGVGKGAFKETFHVTSEDGQSEALKIYLPGHSPQRNEREISAIKRCDHPNIARLKSVESFEWKGIKYLVSREEFIAGGTLTNRVSTSLLSAEEVQTLGATLISAVSHIASLDLVHRDLKPDNIMLREDGVTPI